MHQTEAEDRMDFTDKVVVITGGGGGIGKAAARRFLDGGARVVLSGTRRHVLEAARDELDASGERVEIVAGQITHRDQAQTLIERAVERFGGVDVLVNSTGIFRIVPFLEQTEDMRLAVTEACTNVVRHAYADGEPGPVEILIRPEGDTLQVVVSDH